MNSRSGFTLIELMIVVIILAALAGMVLPRVLDRADDAKRNIAMGEIASITTALKFYKLDNGSFPTGDGQNALESALMRGPVGSNQGGQWKGPYLEKAPNDPWGRPYQYRYPGQHGTAGFDLWSMGPDENSAEDDITNWQSE